MLAKPEFWLVITFVVFLFILARFKVHTRVFEYLDARSDRIRKDMENARSLRDEARSLLASVERKIQELEELGKEEIISAEKNAKNALKQVKVEAKTDLDAKIVMVENRLRLAEGALVSDIRDRAVHIIIEAIELVISEDLSSKENSLLYDGVIQKFPNILEKMKD
jgi:F-type H+-transporting ATPase subunit b